MSRATRWLLAATATALALAGAGGAASGASRFAAARTAAGPSADVLELGGVSLARDGTGAVAWLQSELTQPHVFAARLKRGDPTGSVRIDTGQIAASSDVRVATGDRGRTVVTWINGGTLYGAVEKTAGAGFGAPVVICACGPSEPSLDISRFGTAYLTFTAPGGGGSDVRAAVLEGSDWQLIPDAVDIDGAHEAFGARVAASSDGTGIAAWTERDAGGVTHVYERRLLHDALSKVPRAASLASISNRAGGNADSPSLGVTDESSFAWVAFRQDFTDGAAVRSRVLARRLRGSAFDYTFQLDGLRFPTSAGARSPAIGLSGRGYGVAAAAKVPSNGVTGAVLVKKHLKVDPGFRRPSTIEAGNQAPPVVVASAAESSHGMVVWQRTPGGGGAQVVARYHDGEHFQKAVVLSPGALGPTAAELGLDAQGDDADDQVIAFVQGDPGARRIQVVAYPGELDIREIVTRRLWYRTRRPHIRWDHVPAAPWGPVTYRVEVDGRPVGKTRKTQLTPSVDLREGMHSVRVVAIDGRGAETLGDDEDLGTDTRAPTGNVKRKRDGLYRVWAADGSRGSGVFSAVLDFGSGGKLEVPVSSTGRLRGVHIGTRKGLGIPRLLLRDRAGNRAVID